MNDPAQAPRAGAVFDLDNTLLPGVSAERLFVRFLIAKRLLGARAAAATLVAVLRYVRDGPAHTLRVRRPYLRGWEVERLRQLGEEAVKDAILPRLSGTGVQRLQQHLRAGHRTAIVSGSLPFLLGPLGRALGVHVVVGAPLHAVDGRYSGNLTGEHTFGLRKAVVTRQFALDEQVDLSRSFAYADHHSDRYFLELFGHPVCVNPTPRLRVLARGRGWPIERWPAHAPDVRA